MPQDETVNLEISLKCTNAQTGAGIETIHKEYVVSLANAMALQATLVDVLKARLGDSMKKHGAA